MQDESVWRENRAIQLGIQVPFGYCAAWAGGIVSEGWLMSPEAKKLKVSGIVALIAGCLCVVAGIVLAVLGVDITDLFVVAASVLALLVGAKGARVANVPSNAPGLVGPSAGATVATGALCAGDVVFANGQVAPIVVGAVAFVLALLVTIAAAAVKKAVEKV